MIYLLEILRRVRALFSARRRPAPTPTTIEMPWVGATRAAEQLLQAFNNQEIKK